MTKLWDIDKFVKERNHKQEFAGGYAKLAEIHNSDRLYQDKIKTIMEVFRVSTSTATSYLAKTRIIEGVRQHELQA